MKNYIMIAIFGLVAMLTFTVQFDAIPVDVGKQDQSFNIDDVGVYANVVLAVDYNMQTHGVQTRTDYVAANYSIPANELIPKPGWQSVEAKVVNTQYFKGLHRIKI